MTMWWRRHVLYMGCAWRNCCWPSVKEAAGTPCGLALLLVRVSPWLCDEATPCHGIFVLMLWLLILLDAMVLVILLFQSLVVFSCCSFWVVVAAVVVLLMYSLLDVLCCWCNSFCLLCAFSQLLVWSSCMVSVLLHACWRTGLVPPSSLSSGTWTGGLHRWDHKVCFKLADILWKIVKLNRKMGELMTKWMILLKWKKFADPRIILIFL